MGFPTKYVDLATGEVVPVSLAMETLTFDSLSDLEH